MRDEIMGREPHDFDVAVSRLTEAELARVIPRARRVGRSFPVYRARIGGSSVDVALARTESKSGVGHRGFAVECGEHVSIEDDLARRDLTINAIARDLITDEIIDPFDGYGDIERRVVRAVSRAFTDDALRALRAARFSGQLMFDITDGTYDMMASCADELRVLSASRVVGELERALECSAPSRFFRALVRAGVLEISFPILASLGADGVDAAAVRVDSASAMTSDARVRYAALMCGAPDEVLRGLPREVRASWRDAAAAASRWASRARRGMIARDALDMLEDLRRARLAPEELQTIVSAGGGEDVPCLAPEVSREVFASRAEIPTGVRGPDAGAYAQRARLDALERIIRRYPPPSCRTE